MMLLNGTAKFASRLVVVLVSSIFALSLFGCSSSGNQSPDTGDGGETVSVTQRSDTGTAVTKAKSSSSSKTSSSKTSSSKTTKLADGDYHGVSYSDYGQIDAWLTISKGKVYSLEFSGEYASDDAYVVVADSVRNAIVNGTTIPTGGFEGELVYAYEGALAQASGSMTAAAQNTAATSRRDTVLQQREAQQASVQASVTNEQTVYITESGSKYHRSGCRYLKKSKIAISLSDAQAQGYTACSVCF